MKISITTLTFSLLMQTIVLAETQPTAADLPPGGDGTRWRQMSHEELDQYSNWYNERRADLLDAKARADGKTLDEQMLDLKNIVSEVVNASTTEKKDFELHMRVVLNQAWEFVEKIWIPSENSEWKGIPGVLKGKNHDDLRLRILSESVQLATDFMLVDDQYVSKVKAAHGETVENVQSLFCSEDQSTVEAKIAAFETETKERFDKDAPKELSGEELSKKGSAAGEAARAKLPQKQRTETIGQNAYSEAYKKQVEKLTTDYKELKKKHDELLEAALADGRSKIYTQWIGILQPKQCRQDTAQLAYKRLLKVLEWAQSIAAPHVKCNFLKYGLQHWVLTMELPKQEDWQFFAREVKKTRLLVQGLASEGHRYFENGVVKKKGNVPEGTPEVHVEKLEQHIAWIFNQLIEKLESSLEIEAGSRETLDTWPWSKKVTQSIELLKTIEKVRD